MLAHRVVMEAIGSLAKKRLRANPRPRYRDSVCRSIRTLRSHVEPATEEQILSAALRYVRKVSCYREPSRKNAEAFERAVDAVSEALLDAVSPAGTRADPAPGTRSGTRGVPT